MTRYERKQFFERLVTLRDAYRAERQVTVELTIDTLGAFAQAMYDALAAAERHEESAAGGGAGVTATPAD